MDETTLFFPPDTDLDLSFTSTTTDHTFTSSSARTSLARTSSLALSFNDRLSTATAYATDTASAAVTRRPHRSSDPHWSAIKAATTLSSDGRLHLRHLKLLRHVGSGNLGRVFLCRLRDYDGANFALKVVDKDLLTPKKLSHAETEADILHALDHPFLPTLYARIDVSHYTCLLIDYCPGGDLHSLLRKQPGNRLTISAARFFAAEVLVALEYLHALGIVYRDLKPENVLLREDGHVMLSDFDLCFKADVVPLFETRAHKPSASSTSSCLSCNNSATTERVVAEFVAEPTTAFSRSCVGTHEYLAPELVTGNGHGNGVDWWAFGVFVYELLHGTTPFKGCSKEGTLRNIASSNDVRFYEVEGEDAGMAVARDLIEKLLVKDPRRRLGCARGATDIKRHPFFDGIKWPLIRTYRPPEVKGLLRRNKSHLSHVTSQRRRSWWKRLGDAMRECSYYVKTGQCKFSATCKFHHPLPTGVQIQAPPPVPPVSPLPVPVPSPLYQNVQSPSGPSSQQIGVLVARPPLLPGSFVHSPYGPVVVSPTMVPFSGWGPYQASATSPVLPSSSPSNVGSTQLYGITHLPSSAAAYTGPYQPSGFSVGPSSSSQKQSFSERPYPPEIQYYSKIGESKLGPSYRYQHQADMNAAPKVNVILSPAGLPLRPGAPPCTHYAQRGVCKFGPACKFDHPMSSMSYSPSASSLTDMPVAPYPVGSSIGTLAPPSSSSELQPGLTTGSNKESVPSRISSSMNTSTGSVGLTLSTGEPVSQSSTQPSAQSSIPLAAVNSTTSSNVSHTSS